ncbi:MAG: hypothetical protein KC464_18145 [Myxococcales bacterium]|nr:hypothetical protein [Myxococcales bacterium]
MNEDRLYERIAEILEEARAQVVRTVNTAMVHAYWLIGREIVHVEQGGAARAGYGDEVIKHLAQRLTRQYGKGWSVSSLKRMRQFFQVFPKGSAIGSTALSQSAAPAQIGSAAQTESGAAAFPPLLSWSHYLVLLRVRDDAARAFYEVEAARENWSTRELERQVGALLYDRLRRSRDQEGVKALTNGQDVATASDVIKDPFVLEFLDLGEHPHFHERDLE